MSSRAGGSLIRTFSRSSNFLRFWAPFWSHFGTQVRHYTRFWRLQGSPRRPSKEHEKKCEKRPNSTLEKGGVGSMSSTLWGRGKTPLSGKSIQKHVGKRHFRKTAQTGAVRKGGLLRGKVSQGRPHPLSLALRCEGQTLGKKKT